MTGGRRPVPIAAGGMITEQLNVVSFIIQRAPKADDNDKIVLFEIIKHDVDARSRHVYCEARKKINNISIVVQHPIRALDTFISVALVFILSARTERKTVEKPRRAVPSRPSPSAAGPLSSASRRIRRNVAATRLERTPSAPVSAARRPGDSRRASPSGGPVAAEPVVDVGERPRHPGPGTRRRGLRPRGAPPTSRRGRTSCII